MCYDSLRGNTILFGGYIGSGVYSNQTWLFNPIANNWTNLSPVNPPTARYMTAMVYDPDHDKLLLFGGGNYHQGILFGDTWAYDISANSWESRAPTNAPSPRFLHAMSYDTQAHRAILFGGANLGGGVVGDTWAYDYDANNWVLLSPSVSPPGRSYHEMAYSPSSQQTLLFGGRDSSQFFTDTWAFDSLLAAWVSKSPTVAPSARLKPGFCYDGYSERFVLFGGCTDIYNTSTFLDDTWAYDLASNAWTLFTPSSHPSIRTWPSMAFDAGRQRSLLFGGRINGGGNYSNETWSLVLTSTTPSPILTVTPTSLNFSTTAATLPFTIANVGGGTLTWSTTTATSWLSSVTPSSGSLAAGGSQVVQVTVSRAGKSPGVYSSQIGVASDGGGTSLPVQMTVPEPPFALSGLTVAPTTGVASWQPVHVAAISPLAGNWSVRIYNSQWIEVTAYGSLTYQSANPGALLNASWTPFGSYSVTGTHYAFLEVASATRTATASLAFGVYNFSVMITSLQYLDSGGNLIPAPSPGVPFRMRITFQNQLSTPLAQVFVPIMLNSYYLGGGQRYDVQPGQSMSIDVDCPGLPAGAYPLAVFAWGGLAGPPLADPLRLTLVTLGSGL